MTDTDFDRHERRLWAGRATAYARSFAALCARPAPDLLDAAGVGPGTRLLDAGTGPGTVAGLAIVRGAAVTAVDAEPSMLDAARTRVPTAEFRHAILPVLPFPDGAFDAVVANFVVNHVGDPAAAVAELRRVTRPGGRVAVTIWPSPAPPLQRLWRRVAEAAEITATNGSTVDADKNFARSAGGLTGLLCTAGLSDVRTTTLTWTHHTDPEDWWHGSASGLGSLGTALIGQPPEAVATVRRHFDRLAAEFRTPEGSLALPTAALLASGAA